MLAEGWNDFIVAPKGDACSALFRKSRRPGLFGVSAIWGEKRNEEGEPSSGEGMIDLIDEYGEWARPRGRSGQERGEERSGSTMNGRAEGMQ